MAVACYVYQPLAPSEIRVLSISKPVEHQRIHTLRHVRLTDKPTPRKSNATHPPYLRTSWATFKSHFVKNSLPFIALSYTWDGQEPEHEIVVWDDRINKECVLKVTKNIYSALPLLATLYPDKSWWIDAVCINQADIDEKSAQIPLMRDIYMGAEKVVAWLGETTPSLQFAIDELGGLTEKFGSIKGRKHRYEARVSKIIADPEGNATFLEGAHELFNRSWFRRTWTIQEAVLPDGALELICGRNVLNVWAVGDLAEAMAFQAIAAARETADANGQASSIENVSKFLEALELRKRKPLDDISIFRWLEIARSRLAKLEVDKVYGVLGLVDEATRQKIKIDYSQPAAKVYVELVSLLISEGAPIPFVLHFASGQRQMTELPSWCPNLDSEPPAVPLADIFGLPKNIYAAGKHKWWLEYQSSTLNPGNPMLLNARGFRVDVVSVVVGSNFKNIPEIRFSGPVTNAERAAAPETFAWEKECHDLIDKGYSTRKEDPFDVYQRTLIADVFRWQRCGPFKASAGYKVFMQHLTHIAMNKEMMSVSLKDLGKLVSYQEAIASACFARRFLRTCNGRVGLGPPHSQPGDVIVLIPDSPWPFLFRQKKTSSSRGNESGPMYEFIGDAYVNGMMYGEVMLNMDPDRIEEFVLE